MSGVYIKGMEIPKEYSMIFAIRTDGMVEDVMGCFIGKAIPVPDHGRCIDADALEMKRRAENAQKGWHDSFAVVFQGDPYYEAVYDCTNDFKKLVDDAPTIIPADEEGGK